MLCWIVRWDMMYAFWFSLSGSIRMSTIFSLFHGPIAPLRLTAESILFVIQLDFEFGMLAVKQSIKIPSIDTNVSCKLDKELFFALIVP